MSNGVTPTVMTLHQQVPHGSSLAARPRRPSAEVQAWRQSRLLEVGFDRVLAESIAAEPCIDLHALMQLLDRGCPPDLAARILAPLPDGLQGQVAP